jgi:hypothetical protein
MKDVDPVKVKTGFAAVHAELQRLLRVAAVARLVPLTTFVHTVGKADACGVGAHPQVIDTVIAAVEDEQPSLTVIVKVAEPATLTRTRVLAQFVVLPVGDAPAIVRHWQGVLGTQAFPLLSKN